MDTNRPVGASGTPYIWLRYSKQFTSEDGRTHTIEIGIPVPLGASVEERARLIREAEAGMEQLAQSVEGRAAQMLQQGRSMEPVPAPVKPSLLNPCLLLSRFLHARRLNLLRWRSGAQPRSQPAPPPVFRCLSHPLRARGRVGE